MSSTIRTISACSRGLLAMFIFADAPHGFVYHAFQLVSGDAGERFADFAYSLIEQVPFDGILDEFRKGSLFEAP